VLFSALLKARLVPALPEIEKPESPEAWPGDEAVEYSKCGRTDRGVSAFGQVVGVRVRSSRPVPKPKTIAMEINGVVEEAEEEEEMPWDDIADELPYTQILNRLLPPTIRILAWSPNPPEGFSARFNCRARHYRYFFTNPMLAPTNESATLDIDAMNTAASYFLGSHDFRNFCKLDPAKQIDNFSREILHASIERLPGDSTTAAAYYFDLKGTAFLWHQVRHMMAILFLVGQGLEKPEIVRDMLDISVFPTKPMYEMADDRPLVLWDCVFPDDGLKWIVADEGDIRGALADTTWMEWHRKKIDEVLAGELVALVQRILETRQKGPEQSGPTAAKRRKRAKAGHVLVLGTGEAVLRGKFIAMKDRKRMRPVKEINESFLERKGDWRERREKKRKSTEEVEGKE
jgi:tRNA pseudouridine38/39 synthase